MGAEVPGIIAPLPEILLDVGIEFDWGSPTEAEDGLADVLVVVWGNGFVAAVIFVVTLAVVPRSYQLCIFDKSRSFTKQRRDSSFILIPPHSTMRKPVGDLGLMVARYSTPLILAVRRNAPLPISCHWASSTWMSPSNT